jgi:hypothetical protein
MHCPIEQILVVTLSDYEANTDSIIFKSYIQLPLDKDWAMVN